MKYLLDTNICIYAQKDNQNDAAGYKIDRKECLLSVGN